MRIARIRHLFYPDMPRDYFYELSMRQTKVGHTVDLITWRKNKENRIEEKIIEGFMVHRLNGLNLCPKSVNQDYPILPGLSSKLEELKPEIVHAESHLFLPTIQALWVAKKLGVPCVITVHGVFAERGFYVNSAQQAYLHTIGLSAFRSASKVICLTPSDATEVEKIGCPKDKIELIQNAVDTEFFKPSNSKSDDTIVWVGRFVQEKGVEYIVEAARSISKTYPKIKILLIGYGPLKEKIIEMARNFGLLDSNIFIEGPFNREEVARIMGKATIFVFPSLKEGMPIALLEAMACELPVVVFNVSGSRELVEHGKNGLIIEPKNSEQLVTAIQTLLNDKNLRKRLGQNSRRLVVERYSWDIVIKKLELVYGEAISHSHK